MRCSDLFVRLFSLVFFIAVLIPKAAIAELPPMFLLSKTAVEGIQQLSDAMVTNDLFGDRPIVAVYLFTPQNKKPGDLTSDERAEAEMIRSAIQTALTGRGESSINFKVQYRDSERWQGFLTGESSNAALDQKTVVKPGKGESARWVVTGQYWQRMGRWYLRTQLIHVEKGTVQTQTTVSTWDINGIIGLSIVGLL